MAKQIGIRDNVELIFKELKIDKGSIRVLENNSHIDKDLLVESKINNKILKELTHLGQD